MLWHSLAAPLQPPLHTDLPTVNSGYNNKLKRNKRNERGIVSFNRASTDRTDDHRQSTPPIPGYYVLLGLRPSASVQDIRRAYRELSKLYHPDITDLPESIATAKFQELNEAYATLSSPEKRTTYDLRHGYSRLSVIQAPSDLNRPTSARSSRSSAYLDPVDRPLSGGELFALFTLGITFVACLLLVVMIGLVRGEFTWQSLTAQNPPATVMPSSAEAPDPTPTPFNLPPQSPPFITPP